LKSGKKSDRIKDSIWVSSVIVYITSLTQSAIVYNDYDGQKTLSSVSALFMGAISFLGGGVLEWIIWLANPLYIFALSLFIGSNRSSILVATAATGIALSFTGWSSILVAENGRKAAIVGLSVGYWLWVSSILILMIGSISYLRKR
jgi:hypothetical protein